MTLICELGIVWLISQNTKIDNVNSEIGFSKMSRKIYHRNDARPALIGMGLPAKRLLFMCLAQVERHSTKENVILKFESSEPFTITVKDYADLCEIDYSVAYRQIVIGVKELRGYVLEANQGLLKKRDDSLPYDWIEPFTIAEKGTGYSKGDGFVRIKLASEMEPLISNLSGDFTGQFLLSAMQLPDGNAGKLYLILREWISSGFVVEKTTTVESFKEMLGVSTTKTYDSFMRFNEMFLKKTIKTLIEKTEFTSISIEIVERRARKAHKLRVYYDYADKAFSKKYALVDRMLEKTVKKSSQEDTFFFAETNQYLTKNEAENKNLDWNTGKTPAEIIKSITNK